MTFKKFVSLILCACTLLSLFVLNPMTVSAATYTKTSQVSGRDFTSRPKLAKALDAIFAGNASIYSNKKYTKLVNTTLGTKSVPNSSARTDMGAGSQDQCYQGNS